MKTYIKPVVITALYDFIRDYYNDSVYPEYILSLFSKEDFSSYQYRITLESFMKMIQYMQKMSNDHLLAYHAGLYFAKHQLVQYFTTIGIRYSVTQSYYRINSVLQKLFPELRFTILKKNKKSLLLEIHTDESEFSPDYTFIEYIKGIVSGLPFHWDLPMAKTTVKEYPFSITSLLKDNSLIYQKNDTAILLNEKKIAVIKKNSQKKELQFEVTTEELYLKDIFIDKNTLLNTNKACFSIEWTNHKMFTRSLFLTCIFAGFPMAIFAHIYAATSPFTIVVLLCIFELLMLILYLLHALSNQKNIFRKIEKQLLDEMMIHKAITGEAITNTEERLQSIENIMEITKQIIYEKNVVNLFDTIRKLTARALNAERATVFIHDSENKLLRSGPELSEEAKEFAIPENKGIAGEIFRLKKIINVKDAYNNPNFDKTVDRKTGFHTRTILGAPLIDIGENFVGVIQVLNKNDGEFEIIDEHILETLSAYIASALKDTLTIKNLEKRGIDPNIRKGLNSVTAHIFNKYNLLMNNLQRIDNKKITDLNEPIQHIWHMLDKLTFLFNDEYQLKEVPISMKEIHSLIIDFILNKKEEKDITFNYYSSIPLEHSIMTDTILLRRAIFPLLINSIEAIETKGEINIYIYNYSIIPNEIIHEFAIQDIINDYNMFSESNEQSFIDYLLERKPIMENDLNKIIISQEKYIAFDVHDSGRIISKDNKPKIFNPFFSTKNQFGLGLALSQKAAERMKGVLHEPFILEGKKHIQLLIPKIES